MSDNFSFGRRGNLFADLSRVVTEGSHGLGRRVKRQDEGSRIGLKNFLNIL